MRDRPNRRRRDTVTLAAVETEDLWWLAPGLTAAAVVAGVSLLAHPYPVAGTGHVVAVAQWIAYTGVFSPIAGDILPPTPPLGYFLYGALLQITALDPMVLARFGPPVLTVAVTVPYYALARELLADRRVAAAATVLFAVSTPLVEWYFAVGGLVDSIGLGFALTSAFATCRMLRSREPIPRFSSLLHSAGARADAARSTTVHWGVAAAVLLGLTILTRAADATLLLLGLLPFTALFHPSPRGLRRAGAVVAGGVVVAAPWWLAVVGSHGVHGLRAALAPRGMGARGLVKPLLAPLSAEPGVALFFLLSLAGLSYAVGRRRFALPAWLVASAVLIGDYRLQFVAGAMLAAKFLVAAALRTRRANRDRPTVRSTGQSIVVGAVVVLLLASVAVGVFSGATAAGDTSSLNGANERAMTWVINNTEPTAGFAVLGDAAQWFTVYTDRPTVVGPPTGTWAPGGDDGRVTAYRDLSACDDAECVTTVLRRLDDRPQYVYLPTILGRTDVTALRSSLVDSRRYRVVYENSGVVVFRVVSLADGGDDSSTGKQPPEQGSGDGQSPTAAGLSRPRPTPG